MPQSSEDLDKSQSDYNDEFQENFSVTSHGSILNQEKKETVTNILEFNMLSQLSSA